MNISSEVFETNSVDYNSTEVENGFKMTSFVAIFTILLSAPTNSYMIWLIVTGTGNGPVAEFFGLNLAICEILICVEYVVSLLKYKFKNLLNAEELVDAFAVSSRSLFQCLMYVEHYLAVVHPVTFLKYKPLRYRIMCSVFAWVAGLILSGVPFLSSLLQLDTLYWTFLFSEFFLYFCFQFFCCVLVLRALKQSGPGQKTRKKEENHMKRRAFYHILITNVTLTIGYIPYVLLLILSSKDENETFTTMSYASFTLTSLVQPLAFFYRVGKLPIIKCQ